MSRLGAALLLLLLLLSGCTGRSPEITGAKEEGIHSLKEQQRNLSQKAEEAPQAEMEEAEILRMAGVEEGRVEKLTPQRLAELSAEYPAIYGGLPNRTLYQVEVSRGSRGVLIIVDPQEKKVVRKFLTLGVRIGG